ncbi:hypothetical protein ABZ078_42370 [Streptomyces sp. NPDC006385]|uniref:hypothetical protein n=1 Tax=Streptomyces sp. NPDC006385 TaxID=3156761 RepID=UPI0033BC8B65
MREFLNYLPILACPVGMGAMMWFMMRSGRKTTDTAQTPAAEADPRQQELARLRKEVEDLRERMGTQSDAPAEHTR